MTFVRFYPLMETAAAKPMTRLFSLQHDFPSEWHQFTRRGANFKAIIKKEYFNYLTQGRVMNNLQIQLWSINKNNEMNPIPVGAMTTVVSDFTNDLNDLDKKYQSEIELNAAQLDKAALNFMVISYMLG